MVSVEGLSKSYGKQVLFEDISFKVNRKEKIGVVGRNGHGKTTLFRLIAGLEELDSGTISFPRNYRIGYVRQEVAFSEPTILKEASKGLPRDEAGSLWKVEKVLTGLGFERDEFERHPSELSGGFQVRLNLARALLSNFDMLLLDEPNNYLDITSIRWLSQFLLRWPGELMLVTHDRSFMDLVVTHTLGIHRRKTRKISGDTGKYYDQTAQDEETYEKTRINDERKRKEIELFISRFRAKAQLVGLVQSRIKTLARMEKREKLEKIQNLDFSFKYKAFHGKYVMNVRDVSFSYEQKRPLLQNLSISVRARDRVCVIGKNGKGKTTLLKLLAGVLEPQEGEIGSPLAVSPGYFEQSHVAGLQDSNTVHEEIMGVDPERDPGRARHICGLMMFEGNDALKKISVLSGGEKSRVILGKIIASPVNLLLLDEPTNHLDMESSDALLAALDNFDGAVVMVTHNELFLNALAERLVVFQDDRVFVYEGDYGRFLEKVGWKEEERKREAGTEQERECEEREKLGRKDLRRLRSKILVERAKALNPLEERISGIEDRITADEKELIRLNQAVIDASAARNGASLIELSKSMHLLKKEIDSLFAELEVLTAEHERKKTEFDRRLSVLSAGGPKPFPA